MVTLPFRMSILSRIAGFLRLTRLRDSFAYTPRTLRLVWGSSKSASVALGALTLVASALPLGVAYAGKAIMDAVVAGSREATIRWVLIELALVAGLALVQRSLSLIRSLIGARLSIDINVMILEKALSLDLRHFEDARAGDVDAIEGYCQAFRRADYAERVPGVERVGERTVSYKPADGVELIRLWRTITKAASISFSP